MKSNIALSNKSSGKIFLIALLWAALPLAAPPVWADPQSGTSGATFLRLEQGARAIGMGGAFAAVAEGAGALWWNPAGIAHSSFTEVTLSHTQFIEEINSQVVGVARPIALPGGGRGAIGASFTYLAIPGIEGYDSNKNKTGSLDANSMAAGVAFAAMLSPQIAAGVRIQSIREKLHTETGSGFSGDVGVQFRQDKLGLGFVVQHMGPGMRIGGTTSPLPMLYKGAMAYALFPRLTLALDGEKPTDSDMKMHGGAEARLTPMLALRGGWQQLRNAGTGAGMTVGFGFNGIFGAGWGSDSGSWWEQGANDLERAVRRNRGAYLVSLDYAFLSFGDFSNTHRFTLGVKF